MKQFIFQFFLLALFTSVANAQPVIHIGTGENGCTSTQHIGQFTHCFLDSTAKLSIEQVSTAAILKLFKPTNAEQVTFGITPSVMWIHLRLVAPPENGPWFLQAEPPMVIRISSLSMEKQKIMLEQTFVDWKGSLEQVDDVLIIGVRIE